MNKKQISITLGIMCFILTMSIIVQIKTMNNASATVGQTLTENGLRDEVLKWKEKYDSVYSQLGQAENRLEKVRNIATQDSSTSSAKQEELKNNNIYVKCGAAFYRVDFSDFQGVDIIDKNNIRTIYGSNGDIVYKKESKK